jgi:hypothetical protein
VFDPEPKFWNHFHGSSPSSPAVVTNSDMPLYTSGNAYKVYRIFQNYDQVAWTVTVRFASVTDKELCID